jgi:hypothetical protein
MYRWERGLVYRLLGRRVCVGEGEGEGEVVGCGEQVVRRVFGGARL